MAHFLISFWWAHLYYICDYFSFLNELFLSQHDTLIVCESYYNYMSLQRQNLAVQLSENKHFITFITDGQNPETLSHCALIIIISRWQTCYCRNAICGENTLFSGQTEKRRQEKNSLLLYLNGFSCTETWYDNSGRLLIPNVCMVCIHIKLQNKVLLHQHLKEPLNTCQEKRNSTIKSTYFGNISFSAWKDICIASSTVYQLNGI